MKLLVIFAALCFFEVYAEEQVAIAKLTLGNAKGEVCFNQTLTGKVIIMGKITNLTAGYHGFHIHECGDLKTSCLDAKGHYNPFNVSHGGPTDTERHVGDLGNIVADENGVAHIHIEDQVISLSGPYSIIGKSVVVHEGQDDLGKGGFEDSKTTGHAGARAGCGVIDAVKVLN